MWNKRKANANTNIDYPIRVLHEVGRMEAGGIQQLLMNLYHHIDRDKIQFDFMVYRSDDYFKAEIEALGGHIYALDDHMSSSKILNAIKKEYHKFKILRNEQHQILHIHCGKPRFCHVAFIPLLVGIPVRIYHGHNMKRKLSHWWNRLAVYLARELIALSCNHFFACSHAAAEWNLSKKIVRNNRYDIINNGIDLKKFRYDAQKEKEIRHQLNLENKFVIGHIGRFTPAKNHDFLLEIFSEVHKKNQNARLLLVGEGALKKQMQYKAQILGINEAVIFYGAATQVHELLQAINVFVFPSLYEGFGIVALEAQAAGIPLIMSDTIPQEVAITTLCTVLSLKQSASFWADKILERKTFKKEANNEQLAQSGFDIDISAKLLEKLYEKYIFKEKEQL